MGSSPTVRSLPAVAKADGAPAGSSTQRLLARISAADGSPGVPAVPPASVAGSVADDEPPRPAPVFFTVLGLRGNRPIAAGLRKRTARAPSLTTSPWTGFPSSATRAFEPQ